MGQNQVKKQKKYGDYGKQIDKLELNFEQQRKNKFAEERERDVEHMYHSEQPRVLAASRLKKSTGEDIKRSVSAEKTLQTLKFQREQKKLRNEDPTLKKVKEINRCQNVAYFFLNGLELAKVNCSLVHTIPMNYNIPSCQERKEDTCCNKKKSEATQFLQYIEEKNRQEINAIENIDFEELKQLSHSYVSGYVNDNIQQNSDQYDIFMQERNKFMQSSRIDRNKSTNKNSEVSQIIISNGRNQVGSQNIYQSYEFDSQVNSNNRKGKKSSNFYEDDDQLELNSERIKQHKYSDNIELLSNNKMKLSNLVKNQNNYDQTSSHSSAVSDKKNIPHSRSDLKVFTFTKENGYQQESKIYQQPKKTVFNSSQISHLGREDENQFVEFSVHPQQNGKLQSTNTNNQSPFRKNSNLNSNLKNGKNTLPEQNFLQQSNINNNIVSYGQFPIKNSIISETNDHTHSNKHLYDNLQNINKNYSNLNTNIHQNLNNNQNINVNNYQYQNGINSHQNKVSFQTKQTTDQLDNRQRLNSNMDFQEPQLKPYKNNNQKMEGLQITGSVMNSENLSSNYVQEVSPSAALLGFDQRKIDAHDHSKMFQPSMNNASSYLPQEQNYYKIKENGYILDTIQSNNQSKQKDFITPQKTNNYSTYIESTNIVKNTNNLASLEQPKAINNLFDINLENKSNNNMSSLVPGQNFYPTIMVQDTEQRSRSTSNSNINQNLQFNKDSIKQQEERQFAPQSNLQPQSRNIQQLISTQKNGINDQKLNLNQNNYNSTQNTQIPAQNNYNFSPYNLSSNQNEINNSISNNKITYGLTDNNQSYNINQSHSNSNNLYNGILSKLDSTKDKKKIIQLNGKSYQSSTSNIKNQESPYKPKDQSYLSDRRQQKQIRESMNMTSERDLNGTLNFKQISNNQKGQQKDINTKNVIYYLPDNHDESQNVSSRKISQHNNTLPTDKDHVQSLMNQRKQYKYSEDEQNQNQNSQFNGNNDSTKLQSSNYLNSNVKKFYERKQDQLERLSGEKSQSSNYIRNQDKNLQSSQINKYFMHNSNDHSLKKNSRNNMGASLQRVNQTQYENQFSEFDKHNMNRMSASSISPSKLSQIISKPKEGKFDDSFINKDYQEYIPEKVSTQSQIQSFSHIKSMIQETQLNHLKSTVKKHNNDDMLSSKLGSKIKQLTDERQYSPLNSKIFLTSREHQRTHV